MNEQLGELILLASLFSILVVSVFFVVCRRYEDGLFGCLALLLMAGACALLLWDAARGRLEIPAPAYCLLVACVAFFMARHAYRFAMFHWAGKFGWSRPRDHDDDATVPFPFRVGN